MSCTNRIAAAALVGLLGVSAVTAPAAAQTTATASISALAYVSGIAPLTAAGVNDLNFGIATAGTPKTPGSPAADAGRFNISGEPGANVTVSFALPTVLTGGGGATIPITFSSTDGLLWATFPGIFTTFDPNASFATPLVGGSLIIGISGTVSPPVGSTTGNYSGTIAMTVSYL